MRKIFILLVVLVIVAVTDARVPKVGDYVLIDTGRGNTLEGTIEEIANGLICMNVTMSGTMFGKVHNTSLDACFGIGSIRILEWPKTSVATINGK